MEIKETIFATYYTFKIDGVIHTFVVHKKFPEHLLKCNK